MLEKYIQQSIIAYLRVLESMNKLIFIRNNSFAGSIQRVNGSKGYINNKKPGSPDILIFLECGVTVHCELKTEKGKLTDSQKVYKKQVEALGHIYIVIKSIEELEQYLKM